MPPWSNCAPCRFQLDDPTPSNPDIGPQTRDKLVRDGRPLLCHPSKSVNLRLRPPGQRHPNRQSSTPNVPIRVNHQTVPSSSPSIPFFLH